MANDNSKDIANSLNKYTDYAHKGTNLVLDSAENINKWYAEQLNKITESDVDTSRIETGAGKSFSIKLLIEQVLLRYPEDEICVIDPQR
jgi:predicted KAP-like P-loop ATPase